MSRIEEIIRIYKELESTLLSNAELLERFNAEEIELARLLVSQSSLTREQQFHEILHKAHPESIHRIIKLVNDNYDNSIISQGFDLMKGSASVTKRNEAVSEIHNEILHGLENECANLRDSMRSSRLSEEEKKRIDDFINYTDSLESGV